MFPFNAAICVIPTEAFSRRMLISSSKAGRPAEKGVSISCDSRRRSAKNGEEDAKPAGAGRVTMAREEQEREEKRRELATFPCRTHGKC